MADRASADRACKDPNPIIDGRKANVNLAYLGAKPRVIQPGETLDHKCEKQGLSQISHTCNIWISSQLFFTKKSMFLELGLKEKPEERKSRYSSLYLMNGNQFA